MSRNLIRIILIVVVSFQLLGLLVGCSDTQPARLAWISVEKSPIKVIYIDRQGELDPAITRSIFTIVGNTKYKNIKLNENTNISSHASSHQSDIEIDQDVSSAILQRK